MVAETRDNIRRSGISIWLKAELPLLMRRVLKRNNRPLLEKDPEGVMRQLMETRYPVYATPTSPWKAATCRTMPSSARSSRRWP